MKEQLVQGILGKLKEKLYSHTQQIAGFSYRLANYTGPETYEYLGEYCPLRADSMFRGCNTVFVKAQVCFPQEILCNEEYEDCLFLRFANLGGTVFIDGEPYAGIDENRDRIPLRPEWAGKTLELRVEGYRLGVDYDLNPRPMYMAYALFRRVDKTIERYIYDLQLVKDWCEDEARQPQEDNRGLVKRIEAVFEASIANLDVALEGEALRQAVRRAGEILREGLARIDDGDVQPQVHLVASTHIDVAWLWRLCDTIRKCGHSFSNMLRLMDSYPAFTFSSSQVKLLSYTKRYYPALYAQIKQAYAEGRWENIGPMWVESDGNVTSGESLVRQILHGVTFLEKEFGARPRMAWLPDTFGYQPNLPQIFKKSGTEYFYSYKLHWQTDEPFPYGNFRWKGIDGSELVCAVINNPRCGYNGNPTPAAIRATKKEFRQQGVIDEIIYPYGFGDGGGGPTREMIEYALRLKDFPGMPKCELTTAQGFFDRLEKYREKLPVWCGELYVQTHRGTLTTVSESKKSNRRAEMLLQSLEKLAVMAEICGAKPDWALLDEAWEKMLTLQFHDILPGSSIDEVYADSRVTYAEIFDEAQRFMDGLGLAKMPENRVRVVNTLGWQRDIPVCIENAEEAAQVHCGGKPVPCERTEDGKLLFLAQDVVPFSTVEYCIGQADAGTAGRRMHVEQDETGITVENERYLARIDNAGRMVQLTEKASGRSILRAPGNDIRAFLDGPCWEDAWNIEEIYKQRETGVFAQSCVSVAANSDVRTVIRVERWGENSRLWQDIVFYHDNPRIDFETRVDWGDKNKVLRVYFPTTMNAPIYTSEVGFGAYGRPSVGSSQLEKNKFEVNAHRWIDLSENDYGVALMNDSRYGHDVQYDVIGLTLLRCTGFPAKYPDLGEHSFTYSLLPHEGTWAKAGVARAAMELNAEKHTPCVVGLGNLAEGLVFCDSDNLVIDTVKRAVDGDGYIVRLYESNGASGTAKLCFGREVESACVCDLVEKKLCEAEVCENSLCMRYTPYEILSFRVRMK